MRAQMTRKLTSLRRFATALCASVLMASPGVSVASAQSSARVGDVACGSPSVPDYSKRLAGCPGFGSQAPAGQTNATTVTTNPATNSSDPTNPNAFDLSAFPTSASNFEEQLIAESLHDPNLLTNAALLAQAHRQLGRYYAAGGRADLAGTEYARALLADPTDYRSYAGLAQISDAVGAPSGDGSIDLHDAAQRLQDAGNQVDTPAEPDMQVAHSAQWQATTAEFNRRMNSVYTSNAWSSVYRTVFTNLYGH